jgi:ribonucleoside-diphosphate reductase alpha chain
VTVEEIQELIEAQLNATDLPDVARAYIIYRRGRAELRAAKALVGVRDELKLSLAAVTVLSDRYLRRDEKGRLSDSTGELMDRTANHVAAAEDTYDPGSSSRWAERFSSLLRGPEVPAGLADIDERGDSAGVPVWLCRSVT